MESVETMTSVETDLLDQVKEVAKTYLEYKKLVDQIGEGLARKYWLEKGVIYTSGGQLYIPMGRLRQRLMPESHDTKWVGHLWRDQMLALMAMSYFWARMEADIEVFMKSYFMCHQEKVERRLEAGLLQPLLIPERPGSSFSMDFVSDFPR